MAAVFFSYSHNDEGLRDQLETHLSMLKRQGFIETWHDRRITAGDVLDNRINANLERAEIVLLLVSPNFLASDYCYEKEMSRALERHEAGQCKVIPVILRPCDWHDAPFGKLLAAPKDGKPITQWPDIDEAFLDVTRAIKSALSARGATRAASPASFAPKASAPAPVMAAATDIRSSNLRVTERFTDQDKDQFLHDAFEFMAKYFENSLAELSKRNPGIEGRFRRIDANRFTAVAYREGQAVARCGIRLGHPTGMLSGITYSQNDGADNSSYNESLSGGTRRPDALPQGTGHGHDGKRRTPGGQAEPEGRCGALLGPFHCSLAERMNRGIGDGEKYWCSRPRNSCSWPCSVSSLKPAKSPKRS